MNRAATGPNVDSLAGGATADVAPRHDSYVSDDDHQVAVDPAGICELDDSCS